MIYSLQEQKVDAGVNSVIYILEWLGEAMDTFQNNWNLRGRLCCCVLYTPKCFVFEKTNETSYPILDLHRR